MSTRERLGERLDDDRRQVNSRAGVGAWDVADVMAVVSAWLRDESERVEVEEWAALPPTVLRTLADSLIPIPIAPSRMSRETAQAWADGSHTRTHPEHVESCPACGSVNEARAVLGMPPRHPGQSRRSRMIHVRVFPRNLFFESGVYDVPRPDEGARRIEQHLREIEAEGFEIIQVVALSSDYGDWGRGRVVLLREVDG